MAVSETALKALGFNHLDTQEAQAQRSKSARYLAYSIPVQLLALYARPGFFRTLTLSAVVSLINLTEANGRHDWITSNGLKPALRMLELCLGLSAALQAPRISLKLLAFAPTVLEVGVSSWLKTPARVPPPPPAPPRVWDKCSVVPGKSKDLFKEVREDDPVVKAIKQGQRLTRPDILENLCSPRPVDETWQTPLLAVPKEEVDYQGGSGGGIAGSLGPHYAAVVKGRAGVSRVFRKSTGFDQLFGVLDGHEGKETVEIAQKGLKETFFKKFGSAEQKFEGIFQDLYEATKEQTSGTTVAACLFDRNSLHGATLGDSPVTLFRKEGKTWKSYRLSHVEPSNESGIPARGLGFKGHESVSHKPILWALPQPALLNREWFVVAYSGSIRNVMTDRMIGDLIVDWLDHPKKYSSDGGENPSALVIGKAREYAKELEKADIGYTTGDMAATILFDPKKVEDLAGR